MATSPRFRLGLRRFLPSTLALGIAAAIVWWSVRWGQKVQLDERVKLGAAPLVGEWDWHLSWRIIPAILVAIAVIGGYSRLTEQRRWSLTLLIAAFATGAWTLTLALADGFSRVLEPVVHPTEYWANIASFPDPSEMISRAAEIDYLLQFSVHIKGHPPGFPLLLVALDGIGLARPWMVGMLSWLGAATVTPMVMTCVRHLVDEARARTVAPFLILAPYAVWMGTSADALFAAVLFGGLAAVCIGLRSGTSSLKRTYRTSTGWGVLGGLAFGVSVMLTYGAATFMIAPVLVVLGAPSVPWRNRLSVALGGAFGSAAVVLLMKQLGFFWLDGLETVRLFYWAGTAQFRPWAYFMFGNIGALFIALGPAVVAAFTTKKPRGAWILAASGVLCVAAANVSQMSKGEVERIWLIFMPLLVAGTMGLTNNLVGTRTHVRLWLGTQAAAGVLLQVWLISKW